MIKKCSRFLSFVFLCIYFFLLLRFAVINRAASLIYSIFLEPFWSYKEIILKGNTSLIPEVIGNILMFVPIGFFTSVIFKNKKLLFSVIIGLLCSLTIELCQLIFQKGSFELDDLFHNTLGAAIGYLSFSLLKILVKDKINAAVIILGSLCIILAAIYVFNQPKTADSSASSFAFQLDSVETVGDEFVLSGFCFPYDKNTPNKYSMYLKPTAGGKRQKLNLQTGIKREDVNKYFLCEYDYSNSGFVASIASATIKPDEEYEIIVSFNLFQYQPAEAFIKGNRIYYAPKKDFIAPNVIGTDLEEIVNKGYLRVYRPDYYCWVYQYNGCLYWIAEEGFAFEPNGQTYIQYQLETTQVDRLPQIRLENEWYWDNIGGNFEDYEITSEINCGEYRVCKRELPTEYSITSIVTGYHKDGSWIWQNFFRPIYEFK